MKIAKFVHLIFTLFQKFFNIWNKAPDFNEIIVLAYDNSATVLNETYQDKIPVCRVKPVGYFRGDLGFEC